MYGFGDFQPPGYACLASASETAGTMMTSSPCFVRANEISASVHGGWFFDPIDVRPRHRTRRSRPSFADG